MLIGCVVLFIAGVVVGICFGSAVRWSRVVIGGVFSAFEGE